MWVRGLKPCGHCYECESKKSHPMWVRGLKPSNDVPFIVRAVSHPMWVRGLKLTLSCQPEQS